jgi:hypothetical protein
MSTKTETEIETSEPGIASPPVAAPAAFSTSLGWSAPDRETFSFDSYVQGHSTFPTFDHIVYLDQARGLALQHAIEKYEELSAKRRELIESQETPRSRSASLTSDFAETTSVDIEEIEASMTALEAEMKALEEAIKKTSMTLTFQLDNIDKLTSVARLAERAFIKKHGKAREEDDFNHMTLRARFVLLAQLDEFCTGIVSATGNPIEKPGPQGFATLLDRLIPSESVRLLQALNKGLDSSASWASRIDAGFPGGGSDMG